MRIKTRATLTNLLATTVLFAALLPAQTWTQLGPVARSQMSAIFEPATGQMTIFGGNGPNGPLNDLWQTELTTSASPDLVWQQLSPVSSGPSARFGHTAVYDSLLGVITVFGGNSGSICLNDTWQLTGGTSWSSPSSPGPSPPARTNHAASYDPSANSMFIFGGYDCGSEFFNDLWKFTGGVWSQVATMGALPAPRENASLIYDVSSNSLFLFGGDNGPDYFSDTWELRHADGSGGTPVWKQLSCTGPSGRSGHIAAYDSSSDSIIIFGGTNAPGGAGVLNDSWTLNGLSGNPTWTQVVASGETLPRAFGAGAFSPSTGQVFAFGGIIAHGSTYLDDHIFCLQTGATPTWTHKGIRSRYGHTAVFDPNTQKMIVFGGQHTVTYGNLSDTFVGLLTPGSADLQWTPLSPTQPHPPPRWGHAATYNPSSNVMTVFGGGTGLGSYGPCLNDVWLLNNANGLGRPSWSEASPSGTLPSPRAGHGAVYDAATDTMIVFGGTDCSGGYLNDVWLLSPADNATPAWRKLSPSGTAPKAREHAVVLYAGNGTLMVYGGESSGGALSDVWVLTDANGSGASAWTSLLPTGTPPPARSQASGVYDAESNTMTVCGGTGKGSTGLLSDCWALSGADGQGTAAWARVCTTGSVPPRRGATAVWENGNIALFGGAVTSEFTPSDDHTYIMTPAP